MIFSKPLKPDEKADSGRDIFAHWAWVLPILLIVAALGLREIDLYALTTDEFFSLSNSGWLAEGSYTPSDIINSLVNNSPAHVPGYFMILSVWGNLVSLDPTLGRILTVFCALLFLTVTYRITSDFVSPIAGLFASAILVTTAFHNYYIPHIRMYPFILLFAGVALWLYLRILYKLKMPNRTNYVALTIAVYSLANIHAFSATFIITLCVFHLIFVPKNRVWWNVSISVIIAIIFFLPYVPVLTTQGVTQWSARWGNSSVDGLEAMEIWLTLHSNGQPILILLSTIGVAIGRWKNLIKIKSYHFLIVVYLLVLSLLAEITPFVSASAMRHQLHGLLLFYLFVSLGLFSLYRFHRWLAMILLLWVVSGVRFQNEADWKYYLAGRTNAFSDPPWHVISRMIAKDIQVSVIGLSLPLERISHKIPSRLSQKEYYFDRANIGLYVYEGIVDANDHVLKHVSTVPEFWTIYQHSYKRKREANWLRDTATSSMYTSCKKLDIGKDTVLERYRWKTLGCEPAPESLSKYNELIDYNYYAAQVDSTSSRIFFVDEWEARSEAPLDSYSMSFQLISQDWTNEAQLDLPMVHEGMLRHFSIDIAQVPKGRYLLMAILYDKLTGERVAWGDSSANPTEYLPLADVVLE